MSKRHRNQHKRHHGPPAGVPKNPRFKQASKPKALFNFNEWYRPVQEAIARGLNFVSPAMDDATVVVTATSLLDKMLEFAVILNFGPVPTVSDTEWMFSYPGPLSSFAAKINLCAMLGLIAPRMRQDLGTL